MSTQKSPLDDLCAAIDNALMAAFRRGLSIDSGIGILAAKAAEIRSAKPMIEAAIDGIKSREKS